MSRIIPSEKHWVGVRVLEGQLDRRGGGQGGQLLGLLTGGTLSIGGQPPCLEGVEEARTKIIYLDGHPVSLFDRRVHNDCTQLKSSASQELLNKINI